MHVLTAVLFIGFVWRWGDIRNWTIYYSTLLYVAICNLLYNFLCHHYPLWRWVPDWLSNHSLTDLLYIFIIVPAISFLYLSRYPNQSPFKTKLLYFFLWVAAFTLIECVWVWFGKIKYYHGWKVSWSFVFYNIMFILIRVHLKKPLLAIFFTVLVTMFLILVFNVPLNNKH
ncbi:CBO0543 family protein [Ammoniphilus sp. CFH 90114]|uniref:CBO0543 family protein n=1 Tax=Ammoniphilus sp. CFH 90114 TaxID=2493665 RepID=UPI0026B8C103